MNDIDLNFNFGQLNTFYFLEEHEHSFSGIHESTDELLLTLDHSLSLSAQLLTRCDQQNPE